MDGAIKVQGKGGVTFQNAAAVALVGNQKNETVNESEKDRLYTLLSAARHGFSSGPYYLYIYAYTYTYICTTQRLVILIINLKNNTIFTPINCYNSLIII